MSEIDASPLQPIVRDANLLKEFPQLTKSLAIAWATGFFDSQRLGVTPIVVLFIIGVLSDSP